MRKYLFTVLLCVMFLYMSGETCEKHLFRVMSYNVENYFDCVDDSLTRDEEYLPGNIRGWNYNRYLQKQINIARTIVAIGGWTPPSLVGLCEVESRKAMIDLTRYSPLSNLKYAYVHYESPDARGVDVALLYQPESFKLIESQPVSIAFENESKSTTRDILYACGEVPSGDTLYVFVCHFPSRLGGEMESANKREKTAKVLRQQVDVVFSKDNDANIIIMGDFNDYPDNESLEKVLKAVFPEKSFFVGNLYNLMYPLHKAGKGTHKHGGDWGVLDQIIVSGKLLNDSSDFFTSKEAAEIFDADFLSEEDKKFLGKQPFRTYVGMKYNGGFSDHYPVYVDFWY